MKIIIATIRKWHIANALKFRNDYPEHEVKLIFSKKEFIEEEIHAFNPDYIMFPHWSWMIPKSVFSKYRCVVYHISDVPKAKGGSPVQNQIVEGFSRTMISAIAVDAGLDMGNVYIKRELSLMGGGEEIFIRSSKIIFNDMIPYIIENDIIPIPQEKGGYSYKRRTPEDSILPRDVDIIRLFDHIRMLDADGYPVGYIEYGKYRFEFTRPKLTVENIVCDVKISLIEGEI